MKRLKNKRGFTMVELIVVVAIIGVLAGILVPTVMGMVTKARVMSANSTASNIKKSVDLMLLQADAAHYGVKTNAVQVFNITVTSSGNDVTWTCSAADPANFSNGGTVRWGTAATYVVGNNSTLNEHSGESLICAMLSENLGSLRRGSMVVAMRGGSGTFVAFTDNSTEVLPESEYPPITNGVPAVEFEWDGHTAGISPRGFIIGTAPQVPLVGG